MKPESLHALVIDHHSGELSPEMVDLLEAYLTSNTAAREDAARIVEVLRLTSETVARHPECVRVFSHAEIKPAREVRRKWAQPLSLKAAAVIAFSTLTAAGGFYVGSARSRATVVASAAPVASRKDSPWARYRMALDPLGGGMQVVRVDIAEREARP
jgi:anti-sigma factor RsiW